MGIIEWFRIKGWNLEKTLFALQRLTGWGLTLFLIAHIIVDHQIVYGESVWNSFLAIESTPFMRVILLLIAIALLFHGLNGIRIILTEFGILLTKPKEPEYPYQPWFKAKKHRDLVITIIIMVILLTAYVGVVIL